MNEWNTLEPMKSSYTGDSLWPFHVFCNVSKVPVTVSKNGDLELADEGMGPTSNGSSPDWAELQNWPSPYTEHFLCRRQHLGFVGL